MKEINPKIFSNFHLKFFHIMKLFVVIKNLKLSVTAEVVGKEFLKFGRVLSSVTEWREGLLFLDGRVEVECEMRNDDVGRMKEICVFEGSSIEICEKKDKKEKFVEERLEKFERRESSFIFLLLSFCFQIVCFFHFVCVQNRR
jgi:hypothetical protein